MHPDSIFAEYCSKITSLRLYQVATQNLTKKEFEELQRTEETIKNHQPELDGKPISHRRMYFQSVEDGEHISFGLVAHTIQDQRLSLLIHKNKQYQWLLAEAYEEFEDYLECMYACAGYQNHNFWPVSDFGNVTLSEIEDQCFDWFRERAKNKKGAPGSITNTFRDRFPRIQTLEINNELGVNLRMTTSLVENLRHIIVHKGGRCDDKNIFLINVLKKAGIYNNGKYDAKYTEYILRFFGSGEYSNNIMLLEVPIHEDIPLNIHINVFEVLSNYLMSYAHLVYEEVKLM